MSAQGIREFINRHAPSMTALASLGALLDARAHGHTIDPVLETRLWEVLDAFGARSLLDDVGGKEAAHFVYELRQWFGSDANLLCPDTHATAWCYGDPRLLQAAGDFSRNFARGMTANIIPALDGLGARFAAGARFLDIGVGVAGLACELASLWPQLQITGIDVWTPSLALARENVMAAGLADRITLREQAAEALTEEQAYDLVWMPLIFMPQPIVPTALDRALAALKPGAWNLLAFANWDVPDPTQRALWRLRSTMFGGGLWTTAQVSDLLRDRGFADVRNLPVPPGAPTLVAARRPQ